MLSKYNNTNFVPEKHLLAKRLAQCLTSYLPSGVHLKALETYHIVFTRISTAQLASDLPLYAGGLFPLLAHCSTSLKAPLLSLYETHFLPLGQKLKPVLDGFILAILPGLEDETSEFYSRSRTLLDNVELAVGDAGLFARGIWRALLQSPPIRFSAAHYLRTKLSTADEGLRSQILNDMPLVAYAITAALSDNDALTQRIVLDLLLGELSLNSPFFHVESPDRQDAATALVCGVFGTLLRKDVSLTKRVHTWLLGGKVGEAAIEFCNNFSKHLVLDAVDKEISTVLSTLDPSDTKQATRPCKIVLALTDRTELCDCLGHHMALRMLDFGRVTTTKANANTTEIIAAIGDLLHDLGSSRIFEELECVLSPEKQATLDDFALLSFSLSMFPTKDHIVGRKYLPALLEVAVRSLNSISGNTGILDKAVDFCGKAMAAMCLSKDIDVDDSLREQIHQIVSIFASFFVAWLAHSVQAAPPELRRAYFDVTVSEEYTAEVSMAAAHEEQTDVVRIAKNACTFFVSVSNFRSGDSDFQDVALHATAKCTSSADIRISLAGAKAFADISDLPARNADDQPGYDEQVMGVVRRCWRQMHPSLRTATAQSAQALLALQRSYPEEVKVTIADGILSSNLSRRLRNLERFACLWRQAVEHRLLPRPSDNGLFLMLDALADEHWGPKMLARSWLSDALELDAPSVIDAPLRLLLCYESRSVGPKHEFLSVYDAPRALYAFQTLRSILESCPTAVGTVNNQLLTSPTSNSHSRKGTNRDRTGVRALAMSPPSPQTAQSLATLFAVQNSHSGPSGVQSTALPIKDGPVSLSELLPAHNYVIAIILTCLGYLRGRVPDFLLNRKDDKMSAVRSTASIDEETVSKEDEDILWALDGLGTKSMAELHEGVCAAAAECLAALLSTVPVPSQMSSVLANSFAAPLLNLVSHSVGNVDPVLQLHFLNAVSFMITADGPCYLFSIIGRDSFKSSMLERQRAYSENQLQLHSTKRLDQGSSRVQVSATESLDLFVPWIFLGVVTACLNDHSNPDSGSQEVLGVRRRWIQLIDTALKHVGVHLPVITEGLLLIFCEFLHKVWRDSNIRTFGDSEFSRVDETLLLLEGVFVVASNVLWSFEHALTGGDLRDGSQTTPQLEIDQPVRSTTPLNGVENFSHAGRAINASSEASLSSISTDHPPAPGGISFVERASSVTNATSAVMSALNPLRMINDFVKDVLIGSGADISNRLLDPRRSAARLLFTALPNVILNIARVWGPSDSQKEVESRKDELEGTAPRLSTELPRERRQAQRASVVSILEVFFEVRPVDVIAGIVAIFYREQDEYGVLTSSTEKESIARISCHMLHAMDFATPDAVVGCVKTLFEKASKWVDSSVEANEGRAQATLRQKALEEIDTIVSHVTTPIENIPILSIGKCAATDQNAPIPGGTFGNESSQASYSSANGALFKHKDMFHWGDFFAEYSPEFVETACLNFLEVFLDTCTDGDDIQGSWSTLFPLLKDALNTSHCKAAIPIILRVLGRFVLKSPSPFPDRRIRREIMVAGSLGISSYTPLAGGTAEISTLEHKNIPFFKKKLAIIAFKAAALSIPPLVESAFLEDKQQLSSSVNASIAPATVVLKKAAARSSSILTALNSKPVISEDSLKHEAETIVDLAACEAAASVLLNMSAKDWGTKYVRREVVTLLEDPNFFFGKNRAVLSRLSSIVKEVVAGGGASLLFTSLGTYSSNATPGLPSLFIGRDSETVLRSRAIRRLAFCMFVSEPDFYSSQMPFVLERIRDALRMTNSSLVAECLLCLRALLLRTGPSSISAFRATVLSEMFRILGKPSDDLTAVLGVLRFLDLLIILSPPEYSYELCFFLGEGLEYNDAELDGPERVENSDAALQATSLIFNVISLWTTGEYSLESVFITPFRLEPGKTVLGNSAIPEITGPFLGRYAAALLARNSMPKMKAAIPHRESLYADFEGEFLHSSIIK